MRSTGNTRPANCDEIDGGDEILVILFSYKNLRTKILLINHWVYFNFSLQKKTFSHRL